MEKIEDLPNGVMWPLRVTRRAMRLIGLRRYVGPSIRIKCGCCTESVVICHDEKSHGIHTDTLEINGVIGTVAQWRKVLLPLLSVPQPEE